ncbi:hypothetical protein YB2330_002042 [Saitoella coloradoensis]
MSHRLETDDSGIALTDTVIEDIKPDDICPLCHELLYRPITTTCSHTFCESCWKHWGDVSLGHADVDEIVMMEIDEDEDFLVTCPLCRTRTRSRVATERTLQLLETYPATSGIRQRELAEEPEADTDADFAAQESSGELVSIYIGNTHRPITPRPSSANAHEWTFFFRTSHTDIIDHVHIRLHPTFRPPEVVFYSPPYEVRRIGWGVFEIRAFVVLKAGWTWDCEEAFGPDGDTLPVEWMLEFGGVGRKARYRVRVKRTEQPMDPF